MLLSLKQIGSLWLILFLNRLTLFNSSLISFRPQPGGNYLKI
jgi:hypothetical protein